jgi:hypothetical protein
MKWMNPLTLGKRQPFHENIAMAATMLNPRSDRPPSQNPLNSRRLVGEWKQTADGRITCTWALRDANLASVPELCPEEMPLEPDVRTIAGQDRFLVWILRPPRQVRTILGMAGAVVFLGLAAADLSRSTPVNSHQTSQVSVATTRVVPAGAQSAMMDNFPSVIDLDTEFFLGAADGSVGAWIRPPTLRP